MSGEKSKDDSSFWPKPHGIKVSRETGWYGFLQWEITARLRAAVLMEKETRHRRGEQT